MSYVERIFELRGRFASCRDGRKRPVIDTPNVVRSAFVLIATRLGSLNAWQFLQSPPSYVRHWIGKRTASADSIGRVMATVDPAGLRDILFDVSYRLRRNKAFVAPPHGLTALVIDGHECHATYRRRCAGCSVRKITTAQGEREQCYHRYVAAQLVGRDLSLMVDVEPQLPGESEVNAAMRLFERVVGRFARSFDVVLADALYAKAPFWNAVRACGKHLVVVLKEEARDLMGDARSLFARTTPVTIARDSVQCEVRDVSGFKTWTQVGESVRVVQSVETKQWRRQRDKCEASQTSEWIWVTSLPCDLASTETVVSLGHARWTIENQGFNNLVNQWHADHLYRHDGQAILTFILVAFIAINVFEIFHQRALKPALRVQLPRHELARRLLASLYESSPTRLETG